MHVPKKLIFIAILFTLFSWASAAQASSTPESAPEGFKLIDEAAGVQLYRKNYSNGVPDYVQVLDLSMGAQLVPLHGGIAETRPGKGSYDGDDPRFYSKSVQKYWADLNAQYPNAFCVSNGQFFYMKEYPTRLPFPLRIDSEVISDGYDLRGFPEQKLLLLIWPGYADIVPLDKESLYNTTALHGIAGLAEDARKSPSKYVGRTFIGVDDRDGNGLAEIVLVFSTRSARQKDAAAVLRSFGADQVMMLDGGGSAQLHCQGMDYVASERLLPQALGIVAAAREDDAASERASMDPEIPEKDNSAEEEQRKVQAGESNAQPRQQQKGIQPVSIQNSPEAVNLEHVIWVPVSILPLAVIVLLVVDRVRRVD